jgi:adenylosuccinate synthase
VADSNAHPAEAVRAEDLLEATLLKEKLHAVRERKAAEIRNLLAGQARTARLEVERGIFDGEDAVSEMAERARRIAGLGVIHPDERIMDILRPAPTVIFEGAQGVLLDQDSGFHPYTTWSRCTSVNARALLREAAPGAEIQTMGVLRSHMVRHGPGPLPTETDALSPAVTDHNACGEWQGAVRYGWFDAVLARYALSVEGCADHLAITHLDAPGRLGFWKVCTDYDVDPASPSGGDIVAALRTGSIHREDLPALTQALTHVTPVLEPVPASEQAVAERISDLMGMEVSLRVCGPRSGDVTVTTPGL